MRRNSSGWMKDRRVPQSLRGPARAVREIKPCLRQLQEPVVVLARGCTLGELHRVGGIASIVVFLVHARPVTFSFSGISPRLFIRSWRKKKLEWNRERVRQIVRLVRLNSRG
jgi:hypothetical protein